MGHDAEQAEDAFYAGGGYFHPRTGDPVLPHSIDNTEWGNSPTGRLYHVFEPPKYNFTNPVGRVPYINEPRKLDSEKVMQAITNTVAGDLVYGFDPASGSHLFEYNKITPSLPNRVAMRVFELKDVPNVRDWFHIKQEQRRLEYMSLEEQIEELTRTLADLQRKKRRRDQLQGLYDLPNGAVIIFTMKFPHTEKEYVYSAVKVVENGDECWAISGNAKTGRQGSSTEAFVAWLDHAIEVRTASPTYKVLRGEEHSTELEGMEAVND